MQGIDQAIDRRRAARTGAATQAQSAGRRLSSSVPRFAFSLRRLLPASPPRDLDGRAIVADRERRTALAILVIASSWFALAAGWELFGPVLAGHYASSASVGIIAENMLRWKILGPVWEYTASRPKPEMYYCHHPWGIFWTTAALMKIFGRHDFVCRLPAVLLSAATPPLLYGIGASIWRPAAGAIAAAAFVVLPITLGFANMNALEVPVTAWSLLALWGTVRFVQTWRRRWLVASVVGLGMALHADWPAFILAGELLGLALVDAYLFGDARATTRGLLGAAVGVVIAFAAPWPTFVPPLVRWLLSVLLGLAACTTTFRAVRARRFGQWWALSTAASVATLVLYLGLFARSGKLADLVGSYGLRAAGNESSLASVLAARRYWIELSFSPIAIVLGKVAAVVVLLRAVLTRRALEAIPLMILGMAVVQYVVFKQGADIHVFWPHYFATFFALGMAAITATLVPLVGALLGAVARQPRFARARRLATSSAGVVAIAVAAVPVAFIARDGIPALRYARETGGRFNEKGLLIDSDGDKTAFLEWLEPTLAPDAVVEFHDGMKVTWAQAWALGGRVITAGRPPPRPGASDPRAVYLMDTRFAPDELQEAVARDFHVVAVGPFWKISPSEPAAPIDAWSFVEREPTPLEWYFVSGTEPDRAIVADPYATWELRTHFGQTAEAPKEPPLNVDQRRIAHNVAVAAGDTAGASEIEASIVRELAPSRAVFEGGTEIVGTSFTEGARSLLTIFVRAAGPEAGGVELAVRSEVVHRAAWSTTMADPTKREVGLPLAIAPSRWRAGFLYADPVPIRKRPGTEVFRATLSSRAKGMFKRTDGGPAVIECLRL